MVYFGYHRMGTGVTNSTEPFPKLCKEQNYPDNRMCGLLISEGKSVKVAI